MRDYSFDTFADHTIRPRKTAPRTASLRVVSFLAISQTLLVEKKPRQSFDLYAGNDLAQHSPAFGSSRASTITQWEKMFANAGARFKIDSVTTEPGLGIVHFRASWIPENRVLQSYYFSA